MKKKLKLFVWEGVFVDYTSGIAVALASSKEEAIETFKSLDLSESSIEELENTEPKVHKVTTPYATYVYGGG